MSKPWIFVSPSNRGIGHALTRHLLRTTTLPIIATARADTSRVKDSILSSSNSDHIEYGPRLHVMQLDVTDESSIEAASSKAAELFPPRTHHLHLGFALPGILHPEKSPKQVHYEGALETLKVNTLGPLMLMKWFGEFLPRKGTDLSQLRSQDGSPAVGDEISRLPQHATWLTNSGRVGSTSDNRLGGWYSYRASKAGVNSITKSFDLYLQTRSAEKAVAMAYHPGTVKTGLSEEFWGNVREGKLFSPEFAVEKMLEMVAGRKAKDRGRCWDWKGEEVLP
ncbi:Uu.00g112220.m01.CDS01 [Anthostomella pinea]|uniref:Uu.00g112220.m01.CDS01 n=1 Tax=Anthostomella pinea TaxID=933095 RepID=A0AAI8VFA0_9PEZI|nr:Uu.00g112220.m01.CDS01 [Anthostomella pinea]